ncbi:hypothetical protein [Acetobacterium bakii]|uniref:Uncharacterized protein n=1 Tax=Acetobacterium bakii TaxID=52689 RepID=A0A0L6U1R7_9FIRM|nr:hypothetical protein [Acetobacterium bakii]KNZ42451.1 hypothetical protein AKG39_06730 [Acetobacterium bakii]
MRKLGETEVQYAQCLWGPIARVLNSIRDREDDPTITLNANDTEQILSLKVTRDLQEEMMTSSANAGAKKRIDLHIADEQLDSFIEILEAFVSGLNINFDEASRQAPDPTGLEHPNGLSLGATEPITWVRAECSAYFKNSNVHVKTSTSGQIYLDAEKYERGRRIHFGIRNISQDTSSTGYVENTIELKIPYAQLKRFLHSIKIGKKWIS